MPTTWSRWPLIALTGCQTPATLEDTPDDCQVLIDAALRAEQCDERLGPLVADLQANPAEETCRLAVRRLLDSSNHQSRIRSVFDLEAAPDPSPLRPDERRLVAELGQPSTLVLSPDLIPAPGLPATSATVDTVPLEADPQGRLRVQLAPGSRTLRLHYGGKSSAYCVRLQPCATVAVVSHGVTLAHHPNVQPGPC